MPEENKQEEKPHAVHVKTPKGDFLFGNKASFADKPGFIDALMNFQYGLGEESDRGFQEMKRIMSEGKLENKTQTLFEQAEHLEIIGERLSGEPEILHEIEDYFRQVEFYPVIRNQIKKILEYVPSIFPESWKSPESYDKLTEKEKQAYVDIARNGNQGIPGPIIQKVIELAVGYRNKYSKKSK